MASLCGLARSSISNQMLDPEARVNELVDVDTHWWNFPLIHAVFSLDEASTICSLALSPYGQQDWLIWVSTSTDVRLVHEDCLPSWQGEASTG